jgi:hypothetical protein
LAEPDVCRHQFVAGTFGYIHSSRGDLFPFFYVKGVEVSEYFAGFIDYIFVFSGE